MHTYLSHLGGAESRVADGAEALPAFAVREQHVDQVGRVRLRLNHELLHDRQTDSHVSQAQAES